MGLFSRRRHDDPEPAPEGAGAPAPAEPRGTGPWDRDGAPEVPHGRVDLGSLRVPVVDGMQLRLESPRPGAEAVAVILVLGGSTLELRAFAAPRTAGEIFGTRQSGIPEFQVADIVKDYPILEEARKVASQITADPNWRTDPN